MTDIIVVPELENNSWPVEFSGAWINKFINHRNNICFGLYFNNKYPESFILENEQEEELPNAYIVIDQSGTILEIFVRKQYRGKRIATMLCGWTRSYLLAYGIITSAPDSMTDSAKSLYQYISNTYGEPYVEPDGGPFFIVYSDFNGGVDVFSIENS